MTRLRACVAVAVAIAAVAAYPGSRLHASGGVSAPDVEMKDAKGRRVRLADFKGKVVLLDLWASWCPTCEASFPALDALYREYRARGVEVVAVNVDERRKDADAFLETRPHDMRVLFDPRARVVRAFGAPGVPSAYLIDRQGTIRHSFIGHTSANVDYRQQLDALLAEPVP